MQRGLLGRLGCLAWEKTRAIWISETAHVGTLLYGMDGVENCGPADRYLSNSPLIVEIPLRHFLHCRDEQGERANDIEAFRCSDSYHPVSPVSLLAGLLLLIRPADGER